MENLNEPMVGIDEKTSLVHENVVSPPSRITNKKINLNNSERKAIFVSLLNETQVKNGQLKLKFGEIQKTAETFHCSAKTVSRIWKRGTEQMQKINLNLKGKAQLSELNDLDFDVTQRKQGRCGRKQKYAQENFEELIASVPKAERTSLRTLSQATGISKTTLQKYMKTGIVQHHDLPDGNVLMALSIYSEKTKEKTQICSAIIIRGMELRLGCTTAKVAGLSRLQTMEAYRNLGYATQLMEACLAYMEKESFGMSLLFGIPNFFEKFQYVTIMDDWSRILIRPKSIVWSSFPNSKVPTESYYIRSVNFTDLDQVCEIYSSYNAATTCTATRGVAVFESLWSTFLGHELSTNFINYNVAGIQYPSQAVFVIENDEKAIVGYFEYVIYLNGRYNFDSTLPSLLLKEVGYKEEFGEVVPLVLKTLGSIANQHQLLQIECSIPLDSTFAIYTRRVVGTCSMVNFPRDSEAMMCMLNNDAFWDCMCEELFHRRNKLGGDAGNWNGEINFIQALKSKVVVFQKSKVFVRDLVSEHSLSLSSKSSQNTLNIQIPKMKLIQLLLGTATIDALAIDDDVKVSSDAIPLLRQWFPLSSPHIYLNDKY